MKISYPTPAAAYQAVLSAAEQNLVPLIETDDVDTLREQPATRQLRHARSLILTGACLQHGALRCAMALLRVCAPQTEDELRASRRQSMRLGTLAQRYFFTACTPDEKRHWAHLATRAFDYSTSLGFERAAVPLLPMAAEDFFLTAFGCTRAEYTGAHAPHMSSGVLLALSLPLVRAAQALRFDAPAALPILAGLLCAWAGHDALQNNAASEDVVALYLPLQTLACAAADGATLHLIAQCAHAVQRGLGPRASGFAALEAQVQTRLAQVCAETAAEALGAVRGMSIGRPSAPVRLAAARHVHFS